MNCNRVRTFPNRLSRLPKTKFPLFHRPGRWLVQASEHREHLSATGSSGRAAELPFLVGGACVAFACAFGGNWLLRKWSQSSSNGPSTQHRGIVPGSAGV